MNILGCTVNVNPCPEQNQVWVDITTTVDYASLGITAEAVGKSIAFGFGFVLSCFVLGFVAGAVKRIISKM